MGALDPREIAELIHRPVDPEALYAEAIAAWEENPELDPVDRTLTFFTRFYLQDGILTKTDRASSRVSLEARAPFLDNDLVEFVRRLPHEAKFRNGETKYILKKALRGIIPDHAIDRPKKGFGMPLSRWLKSLPKPAADSALPLDLDWLGRKWDAHAADREDVRHGLWCWLALDQSSRSIAHARLRKPAEPAGSAAASLSVAAP
jgi:asparagine synthase (glutamine-hydrolysing)